MKLLIITQKVDKDDAILGFFHRWIEEFAKHCDFVTVICLEEGSHSLPSNVKVLSLGKEDSVSRIKYVTRFYKYIWRERKNYDSVFVHMNQVYVLLGGLLWRICGKTIALWYVHKSVTVQLRLALFLSDIVFTAAKESFCLENSKVQVVGHGIDVDRYVVALDPIHLPLKLISAGRITPIKHLEVIIEAVKILQDRGIQAHLTLVGVPTLPADQRYEKRLRDQVHALGIEDNISFKGSIPHDNMPNEYCRYHISINMAPTGGIDKAVLESISAGLVVIVANKAFANYLGKYADTLICRASPNKLADRIQILLDERNTDVMRRSLRESMYKNASLEKVITTMVNRMSFNV